MKQCICGNTSFTAHHICRHDIVVDGDNNFLSDTGVYDSETPYGPYYCTSCNREYDELDGLAEASEPVAAPLEAADAVAVESEVLRVFEQNKLSETSQSAIHITWDGLSGIFNDLLTQLFERKIRAEAMREEYYYWEISLDKPISTEELETLRDIAQATNFGWDESCFDEDSPIAELCEGLCKKLMAKLLPFDPIVTRADDEGVWFIGNNQ